jgi:DNA-binding beta-propeller fold protein YncE
MGEGKIVRRGGGGGGVLEITGQQIITGEYGEAIAKFDTVAFGNVVENPDVKIKIADPDILPTGNAGYSTAFSPDGTYLSVAHNSSPFITIYKLSGDTFTKLANPDVLPSSTGIGTAFSPDGTYLVVANDSSPFITIYKRSGDTFTKLPDPSTLPPSSGNDAAFSPDGTYLAVAHIDSPHITIYKRSGDNFTKLPNPSTLPTG